FIKQLSIARHSVCVEQFAVILLSIQLLQNQLLALGRPIHSRYVVLSIVSGDLHPHCFSIAYSYYAHPACRRTLAYFGILYRYGVGVNGIRGIYHVKITNGIGINLPERYGLTVWTPSETVPAVKLLLIHPVEGTRN